MRLDVRYRKRTTCPMQIVGATLLIFRLAKVGQHVVKTPAGIAELPPVVEILRLPANVEQAVNRARSAQHFSARLDDLPVVELGFRLGIVEPVHFGVAEQLAVAERDVDPD